METFVYTKNDSTGVLQLMEMEKHTPKDNKIAKAFAELERGIYAALETYSNVHRGSGHNSMVTTHLFEQAREIVLEYLGLNKDKYAVIFCTPRGVLALLKQLEPESYQMVSSMDIGLSLGVRALAVKRKALPKGTPLQSGGGTARLISKDWVVWARAQEKFEAGTPAIINIIAFAKALRIIQHSGKDIFHTPAVEKLTASEILYHDELDKLSGLELLKKLRYALIGRAMRVPTMEGVRPFINLDNSASTRTFTPVWDTFRQTWFQPEHVKQEIIHEVKSICSEFLGAPLAAYDVIFSSNTTESINLVAESLSHESDEEIEPVVLNTILEHSSNDLPWHMIPNSSLIRLSVDEDGFVDLNELESILNDYNQKCQYGKKRIKLVALSGASNVLGVCNNLKEISRIVHLYSAQLLVDAAQLVAHRKIDIEKCGIDYLTFSAHKVYAPFGCGVLVVRNGLLNFNSVEMNLINSSGEENAGGIAALGKALVLIRRIGMNIIQEEEHVLTARALRGMTQINGLEIYGVKRLESTGFTQKLGVIAFGLKNKLATIVGKELASHGGIGVRNGCHCSHIIVKHILHVSPSLERFQRVIVSIFPKLSLPGVVRVSLSIENTKEDIDTLIQVLTEIAGQPPTKKIGSSESEAKGKPILKKAEVQRQMNDFVRTAAERVYS